MPVVGIPRCLLYFYYYPAWETFFREIGAHVKVSPPSDEGLMEEALINSNNDLCFPFKMLYGHVINLASRVDYLFLPRVMSVASKEYLCPKFLGLPDLIRNSELKLPPIIEPTVNFFHGKTSLQRVLWQSARPLTKKPATIYRAFRRSRAKMVDHYNSRLQGKITVDGQKELINKKEKEITVGVLGHAYLILDSFISKGILSFLHQKGVNIMTADNVEGADIAEGLSSCPKEIFWTYNKKLWGAGVGLANSGKVDGIIQISSFGCGPDSILTSLLQKRIRVPTLTLNIDEHTGQAGLQTRIEAFLDLVRRWHSSNEKSDLSPFRQPLYRDGSSD